MQQPFVSDDNEDFPGEDRSFGGSQLYVDLIPSTAWFTNVRSELSRKHWKHLSDRVRARASNTCELCGRIQSRSCDVHERWSYECVSGIRIQRLMRLVCICKACHESTHMGLAEVRGRALQAQSHLAMVNGWSREMVVQHVLDAFDVFAERSEHLWDLDVSLVERAGYELRPRRTGEVRDAVACENLKAAFLDAYAEMFSALLSDWKPEILRRLRGSSLIAASSFAIWEDGTVVSVSVVEFLSYENPTDLVQNVVAAVSPKGRTLIAIRFGHLFAVFFVSQATARIENRVVMCVSGIYFFDTTDGTFLEFEDVDAAFSRSFFLLSNFVLAVKSAWEKQSFVKCVLRFVDFLDAVQVPTESECLDTLHAGHDLNAFQLYRISVSQLVAGP